MRKYLSLVVLALIAVTSLQLWATKDPTAQKETVEQAQPEPQAKVGGAFTLTDQEGKVVSAADFRGRVMLLFFGFTHCPDICPVTVSILSKVMEALGEKGDQVAPVFITVDPKRDTPEVMKQYLANFDKRMVGLTGTPEQIAQVAQLYKAYYAERSDPAHAHGEGDHGKHDYAVDHSGYIYLMGKDGVFIQVFPYNADVQELVRALQPYLN